MSEKSASEKTIIEIPLDKIVPDERQPRKKFEPESLAHLTKSIKRYGVRVPVVVFKVGDKYMLTDGERRWRASQAAGEKTLPAIVTAPINETERLIQQFHIQEQHEEWTSSEKAAAVLRLTDELGIPLNTIGELLSLDDRTVRMYRALADIVDRNHFLRNDVGVSWAEPINTLKNLASKIYENKFQKEFTRGELKDLERAVVSRIHSGDIKKRGDVAKIKDIWVKDPKNIEKFLDLRHSINGLFISSNARDAYYLRNAHISAGYLTTNIRKFLENPNVEVDESQKNAFRIAQRMVKELLARIGE